MALVRARRERSLSTDYQNLVAKLPDHGEIIGHSPAMLELKSKITRMARATGCVLITGESGTGKELIARALHQASSRADRPMLCVNCAAIPPDLMDSQLFGHKAGSFTGADRDHIGFFQQADLGTLFLDEVGEMTLEGQAKLLRILEGHPFLPVGAQKEVSVDVRVIAATNQDLQDLRPRAQISRGSVLSPDRVRAARAAAARARRGHRAAGRFLSRSLPPPARPARAASCRKPAREKLLSYPMARQRAAIAQRDRQRRGAGRRTRRSTSRDLGLHEPVGGELESLKLELLGKAADQRGPAPRQRQRARGRQPAGHRPGHAVS